MNQTRMQPVASIWLVAAVLAGGCRLDNSDSNFGYIQDTDNSVDRVEIEVDWSQGEPLPFGIGGHAGAVIGSHLILAGGTHWESGRKQFVNQVTLYSPIKGSWSFGPPLPHSVAYASAGASLTEFYVAGGTSGVENLNSVYRLSKNPRGEFEWSGLPSLPVPRVFAAGGLANGALFVIGGTPREDDLSAVDAEILALPLDDSRKGWEFRRPLPAHGRALHASVPCNGKIYVFGGCYRDKYKNIVDLQDAYVYSPRDDLWVRLRDLPWPVRGQSAACLEERFVLLAGGFTRASGESPGGFRRELLAYDTRLDLYLPLAEMPVAVMDSEAHLFGSFLLIVGGEDKARSRSSGLTIGALRFLHPLHHEVR